jgi:hypothetical protein
MFFEQKVKSLLDSSEKTEEVEKIGRKERRARHL